MAAAVDGEQAVVDFAYPFVGPGPALAGGVGLWVDAGFLVEVVAVDGGELLQAGHPVGRGIEVVDVGEFQGQAVERCACGCAWSAGGVAAHDPLDVHQAALHIRGGPEGFDGGLGSLAAVGGDQQWCGDAGEQVGVGGGGFTPAPVPVDDVASGGGDQ